MRRSTHSTQTTSCVRPWPRTARFRLMKVKPALESAMRHVLPCTILLGVLLAVPAATGAQSLGTAFT